MTGHGSAKVRQFFSQLGQAREGSVLAITAVTIIVLIGTTGLAIDIGRGQLVQAKLSSSLDAAGLAAGSNISAGNAVSDVQKYMDVNFSDYMGAEITELNVATDASNTVITLSAKAKLNTSFMRIFAKETMSVYASSEITRAISGLELAIVLDNTGSMSGSKLSQLKTAALNLVDILYGENTSADDLFIGLVPFAHTVNVGTSRTDWLDSSYFSSLNWGSTSWEGCVDARLGGEDVTDTPPTIEPFDAFYWADHNSYNDWIRYHSYYGWYYDINSNRGPNTYCSREVTPLTSDRTTIESGINGMVANGGTHINVGAVWGWRMLSPRWRGLWGGEMNAKDLPLDYNTPKMNKAAIIMTDGENTIYNNVDSAHGYLNEGRLGTTNYNAAVDEMDDRLLEICTSMKDNNITVYTVSFGSLGWSTRNMMRDCATQPDYYFDSPSNTELQAAFRAIGDSLSNLRISK